MEQVPVKNNKVRFIYFLVITLDSISFGLINPILAPLLTHSDIFFSSTYSPFLHYCLYGVLISLFPFAFMMGAPILGLLSDRYGRKRILLFSLIITLIAFTCYAISFISKNIEIFMIARLLAGLSAGSQGVAQAAVIDFSKQHEKPLVISTIAIGMTMGLIVGPLVASVWTRTASWVPFGIIIFFSLCSILLMLFYVRDYYQTVTHRITQSSLQHFFKIPGMTQLLMLFLLFELGWSLYYQTVPLWLNLHWHLKNPQLGVFNSYVGTALALCLFLGTRLGLRFVSLVNLIQMGFFLGALTLICLSLQMSFVFFILLVIPIVLAVALIYPGLIAQLSELCSSEQQGLLMGITDALLAFSFAVTGILSGILIYFNSIYPFLAAALFWMAAGFGTLKNKKALLCNSVSM